MEVAGGPRSDLSAGAFAALLAAGVLAAAGVGLLIRSLAVRISSAVGAAAREGAARRTP